MCNNLTMSKIKSHRDLLVWQKSMGLVEEIYKLSRTFPKEELYGLCSQLRRSIVSVPSNIAEGHGRSSRKDYANFVATAKGSLLEAETQLLIAIHLKYVAEDSARNALNLINEIEKMLSALRTKLINH